VSGALLVAGDTFVHELANLLDPSVQTALQELGYDAYRSHNSPIVVVTIERVGAYGSSSIEGLATRWFNEWRIGTLGLEGGSNQGILVLLAVQDRKARIELGATWGRDWDAECTRIMQRDMVPAFKQGDYPGGIRAGVRSLHEMARSGPDSHPPGDFLEDTVKPMCQFTFVSPLVFLLMMLTGVFLILLGFFGFEETHWTLIGVGGALILVGAFSYILLGLFCAVFGGGRSGGSSGGGFSGGFSGGGGATGSW